MGQRTTINSNGHGDNVAPSASDLWKDEPTATHRRRKRESARSSRPLSLFPEDTSPGNEQLGATGASALMPVGNSSALREKGPGMELSRVTHAPSQVEQPGIAGVGHEDTDP